MKPKAIPTHYLGYRFRSRLEARWAVFFETLQLAWGYEIEGFHLPSGNYLPDFFLRIHQSALGRLPSGAGYWVEIKREGEPSEKELRLAGELAHATGHNVFLVAGSPWPGRFRVWKALRDYGNGPTPATEREIGAASYEAHGGAPSEWMLCDREYDMGFGVDPRDAFRRAREARFEHGETPGMPLGWEGIEPVVGDSPEPEPLDDYRDWREAVEEESSADLTEWVDSIAGGAA